MADKPGNEFAQDVSLLDETTGNRLSINSGGALTANIKDGVGNTLTSTVSGDIRALDVHFVPVASGNPTTSNLSSLIANGQGYATSQTINMATAGVDNPLIYIRNPLANTKKMFFYRLAFGIPVTNQLATIKMFYDPTVTSNGGALTPINLNIGGSPSPATSLLCTTIPTVTANGTEISAAVFGQNTQTIEYFNDFSFIINSNHSLLVTGDPGSNNRTLVLYLMWVEV